MSRNRAGLLALLLAAAPALALEDPRPAPAPPRTAEFAAKVDRAVDNGLLWLARKQQVDGSFSLSSGPYPFVMPFDLGLQAVSVYTLRACGLSADDDVARLGYKRMRIAYLAHKKAGALQNYQVSLTLLAIDAYHAPEEEPGKEDRYGKPVSPRRRIPEADLAWIRELVAWLVAAQTPSGSFGYDSPARAAERGSPWEDHSNAQFSLLALKAARRCGVEVPKRVFAAALQHFLAAQEKDGPAAARRERPGAEEKGTGVRARSTVQDRARGWGYQCGSRGMDPASGSMTTAGVSSLVICRGELLGTAGHDAADDARVVQAIHDGIAWLGRNFSVTGNPSGRGGSGSWHYYYLYGLERAGVLSGIHWMGDHDWYGEGAAHLLRAQLEGGGWSASITPGFAGRGRAAPAGGAPGDLLDTCFALLFLKKATFRVEGAVATEQSDDDLDLTAAGEADDASFRAIFDTVFARYGRADGPRRSALVVDFVRMGNRALPLLIQRLEDADPAVRGDAAGILERVTGATRGFRAADPVEARAAAVAAWEEWWFARRGRLAPDVGAGRFRE